MIEQTINRSQKGHGGITGYSTSAGTVQRWVLTSHVIAQCQEDLEDFLDINQNSLKPKDLGKSRIDFDNQCVQNILEVISSIGSPFTHRELLINISSGVVTTQDVAEDIADAYSRGLNAANLFQKRTGDNSFYDPIKKLNLKTFEAMKVKKFINSKEKAVTIAAERSLFARLLIVAKTRSNISMEDVLKFSLSPIPWSLGQADGGLVKTNKSKLFG